MIDNSDLRNLTSFFKKKNKDPPPYTPALASTLAKLVSVPITVPFEQQATRRQELLDRGKIFRRDIQGYTLAREILFSMTFWTVNERLYKFLKTYTDTVTATTVSALLSGFAGGIASYPMDAFRTWKTNYPEKFENEKVLRIVSQIYSEKGFLFLFSGIFDLLGLPLRVVRASFGNSVYFYFYSLSVNYLDNRNLVKSAN